MLSTAGEVRTNLQVTFSNGLKYYSKIKITNGYKKKDTMESILDLIILKDHRYQILWNYEVFEKLITFSKKAYIRLFFKHFIIMIP